MTAVGDARLVVAAFQTVLAKRGVEASRQAAAWFPAVGKTTAAAADLTTRLQPAWRASAELGVAFYRLYAFLMTGRTVASPFITNRQTITTVGTLIRDFERASGVKLGLSVGRRAAGTVRVETPTLRLNVPALFREQQAFTFDQFQRHIEKYETVRPEWYAGVAQQIVADGARDTVMELGDSDGAARSWVRHSTTGSPCSFCAMLISRGVEYQPYRSMRKAGGKLVGGVRVGGKDFHPHCKCVALPVFAQADTDTDPLFKQNRELGAAWKRWHAYEGHKGDGFNSWRTWYEFNYPKPQ